MCSKPPLLDRTKTNAASLQLQRPGLMEGLSYVGTLTVLSHGSEDSDQVTVLVNKELCHLPEVISGASLNSWGGRLARFLASSATDLTRTSKTLWVVARASVLRLSLFDLRKY
jgi:urease accessory protein UreH